ncbi:MAG: transposase [Bacteroidia bacterium]|nr:transposase [Bacteroidia bacterium]
MTLFKNKYRTESLRLQNWDYSSEGSCFITICTQNRVQYFGEIEEGELVISEMGQIAQKIWEKIPNQFPFIELRDYVIMPNHIHGILFINKQTVDTRFIASQSEHSFQSDLSFKFNTSTDIETNFIDSSELKKTGGFANEKNPMLHNNISRVIRWFKGRCTYEIRKIHADFKWQSRFYDHIIRNSESFGIIQNYIKSNPENWSRDSIRVSSYC